MGRIFLQKAQIDLCFSERIIKWNDQIVPIKTLDTFREYLYDPDEDELDDIFAIEIKPRKYEEIEVDTVLQQQEHLNEQQRKQLGIVLSQCEKLFSGKLG